MHLIEAANCRLSPQIVCHACQQRISDFRQAMVVYRPESIDQTAPTLWPVLFCHKADSCQIATREAAGHRRLSDPWDELANHMVMTMANLGMSRAQFDEVHRTLYRQGMVPAERV